MENASPSEWGQSMPVNSTSAAFLFNAFDPLGKIVPLSCIDPGMQLGTAMVILGNYLLELVERNPTDRSKLILRYNSNF